LDFLKALVQFGHVSGTRLEGRARPASNEIEFSYLNGNLMVPRIHQLTLGLQCGCRNDQPQETDNVSAIASGNEGFDNDTIPPSFAKRVGGNIAGRGQEPMPASGEQQ
jgi:hypothetical protein